MSTNSDIADMEKLLEKTGFPSLESMNRTDKPTETPKPVVALEGFDLVRLVAPVTTTTLDCSSKMVSPERMGELISPFYANGLETRKKLISWLQEKTGLNTDSFTLFVPERSHGQCKTVILDLESFDRNYHPFGVLDPGSLVLVEKGYRPPQGAVLCS